MNVSAVFESDFVFDLADCFHKRQRFYVADGTADFGNNNVGFGFFCGKHHAPPYFVGNVRNNLNGFSVVAAFAFGIQYGKVHLAGARAAVFGKADVGKALVMTQVQIGFGPVIGNEDFAVFIRIQSSRIDIQIRIEFLIYDF